MIAEIIAHNIEKARTERGLTQEEAGKIIGLSRATYNGVENGKCPLSVDRLEKLAEYYGVSAEWFLGRPRKVHKFEQMYLYILSHFKDWLPKTKLAKLLYLADFWSYYEDLEPMSGVSYIRRQYGPVADIFFETTDNFYDNGQIDIIPDEFMLRIKARTVNSEWDMLTRKDTQRLDTLCELWRNRRTAEIVNYTHNQSPWMACRDGEIIPYSLIIQEDPDNVYAPHN